MTALIGNNHRRQVEAVGLFLGQAEADDAAALADQHRHLFLGQMSGRKDQIPFVFTVLVIDEQYPPTRLQSGQGLIHPLSRVTELTQ